MKKEAIFVFFVFIFLLSITNITISITGEAITGEAITGKASAQSTNVSITVIASSINLIIIKPENKTYLTNISLLLNYTSTNADFVWYNLDNTANTTITSFIYFNASQGSHTLYLYGNNSQASNSTNVTFIANSTRFIINHSEYQSAEKGSSTDFYTYAYEDIQNLSNIILENTNFGKILFNQIINLTNDLNSTENILNLDFYTNLSSNRIGLNSTALPNFNVSATIWLYNLTFTDPRISKDGEICPSTICTQESYIGGTLKTLKFNVTSFSVYSAEETPSPAPSPTPTGGTSGTGGGATVFKNIILDKDKIKIELRQGEAKKETIAITNTGDTRIRLTLSSSKVEDFLEISEKTFDLNAGEGKTITLNFMAKEETKPNLYMGKLIVKADGIEKEVLIAIEVESKKPLFDVKVEIPKKFLYVMPGEELLANIKLYSLVEIGKVDVKLEYFTNDDEGKIIVSESETISVENQTSFVKEFVLPENIKFGAYILYVKAIYNGQVASASAWFMISQKPFWTLNRTFFVITAAIILVFILIILIELRKLRGHMERYMKINENILVKEKIIKLKPNNPKLLKGGKKWI